MATTTTVSFWPDLARAFGELRWLARPGGLLTAGFSGAARLRAFGVVTRHGVYLHEDAALLEAAAGG